MKGTVIYGVIAMVAVVLIYVVSVAMIIDAARETSLEEKTTSEMLLTESAAYVAETCLKQGGDHIKASFLDENRRKAVCDICPDLCTGKTVIRANMTDVEDSKFSWSLDYGKKKIESDISVSILYDDGTVHAGRLYVNVLT